MLNFDQVMFPIHKEQGVNDGCCKVKTITVSNSTQSGVASLKITIERQCHYWLQLSWNSHVNNLEPPGIPHQALQKSSNIGAGPPEPLNTARNDIFCHFTLWCRKRSMCGKRVMTPHLVCELCLKRVKAVQVYTVEPFLVKQIITYFLPKTADWS